MTQLAALSSIEATRDLLSEEREPEALRAQLLARLDQVVEYNDAAQWGTAVHLCEVLAILGWGTRERVDAVAHYNGDCWTTRFVNAMGESRFRYGRWTKRKAGWVLFNPEYHYSPDRPEFPAKDWRVDAGGDFPPVAMPKLASQRNYWIQMPVIMFLTGGKNPTSERVATLMRDLIAVLRRFLRQNEYGDALERFYLMLHGPALGEEPPTLGLKIGAFRPKKKSFYCDLSFGSGFADLALLEQKGCFVDALNEALSALRKKFAKQKIEYDLEGFGRDLDAALANWCQE